MSIALEVKLQIEAHYNDGFNRSDLAEHLRRDRIDTNVKAINENSGYDAPYSDHYPVIFHYLDRSLLIVSHYLIAAKIEE